MKCLPCARHDLKHREHTSEHSRQNACFNGADIPLSKQSKAEALGEKRVESKKGECRGFQGAARRPVWPQAGEDKAGRGGW